MSLAVAVDEPTYQERNALPILLLIATSTCTLYLIAFPLLRCIGHSVIRLLRTGRRGPSRSSADSLPAWPMCATVGVRFV